MICSCGRSKEDQIYNIEFVFNILNMKCGYIYIYTYCNTFKQVLILFLLINYQ